MSIGNNYVAFSLGSLHKAVLALATELISLRSEKKRFRYEPPGGEKKNDPTLMTVASLMVRRGSQKDIFSTEESI